MSNPSTQTMEFLVGWANVFVGHVQMGVHGSDASRFVSSSDLQAPLEWEVESADESPFGGNAVMHCVTPRGVSIKISPCYNKDATGSPSVFGVTFEIVSDDHTVEKFVSYPSSG